MVSDASKAAAAAEKAASAAKKAASAAKKAAAAAEEAAAAAKRGGKSAAAASSKKKQNKNEGEKKNDGNGGAKKEDSGLITVVLKVDLHCKVYGSKIVEYLKTLDGVKKAKADSDTNKVTVIGKVDPSMLRRVLEQKTEKKVELLSPAPKKDKKNDDGGGDKKAEKKKENKAGDKKTKEVTTAVLKIDKIQRTVSKTKGVEFESIDKQKILVTVTGTMDVKALVASLKDSGTMDVKALVASLKDSGGGGGKKEGKDGDRKARGMLGSG